MRMILLASLLVLAGCVSLDTGAGAVLVTQNSSEVAGAELVASRGMSQGLPWNAGMGRMEALTIRAQNFAHSQGADVAFLTVTNRESGLCATVEAYRR